MARAEHAPQPRRRLWRRHENVEGNVAIRDRPSLATAHFHSIRTAVKIELVGGKAREEVASLLPLSTVGTACRGDPRMKVLGVLSGNDVVNLDVARSEYSRGGVARDRGAPLRCLRTQKTGRVRVVGHEIPLWVPKCLQVWVMVVNTQAHCTVPVGKRVLAIY